MDSIRSAHRKITMAAIRKLAIEEIEQLTQRTRKKRGDGLSQRARVAQEYDTFLADFAPNDYGKVELADSENKLTIRNRLRAAAKRRGWRLIYMPTRGQAIRFQIREGSPS
jgi:hypothetical protein